MIAGRTINVGNVNVCNDDTTLTVTYEATGPWCLLKTDLHVATSENGVPQTKKGNPIPGHFDYGDEHDCVGTVTFEIPLDEIGEDGVEPGDTVVIAAHAEVEDDTGRVEGAWGEGTRFVERGNWAMYFTYVVQARPPSTSCVCDGFTATGGTTGAEILAQLCPGGELAPGAEFLEVGGAFLLQRLPLSYGIVEISGSSCILRDSLVGFGQLTISSSEAEACRAHLLVSCGRPEP